MSYSHYKYLVDNPISDAERDNIVGNCIINIGNLPDGEELLELSGDYLSDPLISTITLHGNFDNLVFDPSTIDDTLKRDRSRYAVMFPSISYITTDSLAIAITEMVPEKEINAPSFKSQITIVVRSSFINDKVYKIKIFKNGGFQIPGVISLHYIDAIIALRAAEGIFLDMGHKCSLYEVHASMINYKTAIKNQKDDILYTDLLAEALEEVKDKYDITSVIPLISTPASLVIKFVRGEQTISVKVYKSGKLNINSCINNNQMIEVFNALETILSTRNFLISFDDLKESFAKGDYSDILLYKPINK